MALITCPECSHNVSDKALACPNCGCPIKDMAPEPKSVNKPQRARKKYKKLPNGYGSIKKLTGHRRKPYAAYPPVKQYYPNGNPKLESAIGYFEDWYTAFDALREYHHSPYDTEKSQYTFADVYHDFYRAKFMNPHVQFSKQSEKIYRWAFNHCPGLHAKKMTEIRKNEMQEILDNCQLGFSSVRSIKNLFSQMFKYALENGIVEKDYSIFIKINIPDDNEKGEPFTKEELSMLWSHCQDKSVQIILILIYSGMRIGELEVVEINLAGGYFKGGIKTKAGKERIVPIHESILPFVQEFDQKNFHAGTFRDKKFYKLIQSVGMPALTNGKKHTPHDCRHTFSWLCDVFGVDDMSKHMMMGHSLGRDVEKSVYGHRTFEQLKTEINKIQIDLSLICH